MAQSATVITIREKDRGFTETDDSLDDVVINVTNANCGVAEPPDIQHAGQSRRDCSVF